MAAHAPRFGTLDLPRPGYSALPLLVLAVVALALEFDPMLGTAGLVAAGCFLVAALARAASARRELAHIRRAVDRLIVLDPRGGEVSELIQWRVHELVAPEGRAALLREVERTIQGLDPAHLPSSSPLRRGALRGHLDRLRSIADRLADEQPVTARGILLVRSLLRDPGSPLYGDTSNEELARMLARVRGALDP